MIQGYIIHFTWKQLKYLVSSAESLQITDRLLLVPRKNHKRLCSLVGDCSTFLQFFQHLYLLSVYFPSGLPFKSLPSISSSTCWSWQDGPTSLPTWRTTRNNKHCSSLSETQREMTTVAVGRSSADLNPMTFDLIFPAIWQVIKGWTERHQSTTNRLPSTRIITSLQIVIWKQKHFIHHFIN